MKPLIVPVQTAFMRQSIIYASSFAERTPSVHRELCGRVDSRAFLTVLKSYAATLPRQVVHERLDLDSGSVNMSDGNPDVPTGNTKTATHRFSINYGSVGPASYTSAASPESAACEAPEMVTHLF